MTVFQHIDAFMVAKRPGLIMVIVTGLVMWALVHLFSTRFLLLIDGQKGPACLPYDVFIVDRHDKELTHGDMFTFVGRKMAPFFPPDIPVTKLVAGLPGDYIEVAGEEMGRTYINGVLQYVKLDLLRHFPEKPANTFNRHEYVPKRKVFALGGMANSYDSRYWGYVDESDILGRTYAIW